MRWWVVHPASMRGRLGRRLVQAHETASHAQTGLEQAPNMLMGPSVRLWCLADGDGERRRGEGDVVRPSRGQVDDP